MEKIHACRLTLKNIHATAEKKFLLLKNSPLPP